MQLWDLHLLRNLLYSGSTLIIPKDIAAWFNVVTLAYFVMSAGSQHRKGLVLSLGKYTSSEHTCYAATEFGLSYYCTITRAYIRRC